MDSVGHQRSGLRLRQNIKAPQGAFVFMRPAWAHSCGCKSRRKLITANEVKRNRMKVTECGEEAWSEAASR